MRGSAAALALASGADLTAIWDVLGPASTALTADTYTPVLLEVARRTADGIARVVVQAGRDPPGSEEVHVQWAQERRGTGAVVRREGGLSRSPSQRPGRR